MNKLAIIGGTGLTNLGNIKIRKQKSVSTPWGEPSAPISIGENSNKEILFLPRHGNPHSVPPHKVNYRANIWALKEMEVTDIIAVNAVGGITEKMSPESIIVPEQIIDYTWGRESSFFEENLNHVTHTDFTHPYSEILRQQLIDVVKGMNIIANGVYGATQGPRLETAAEITRMERDGCDIVGMTGMPEAVLAREQDINYACYALVVNWAAGKSDELVTMEVIERHLHQGMIHILQLLENCISKY